MEISAKSPTRNILEQVIDQHPENLSTQNPMVLSCGGIYIPRRSFTGFTPLRYHILNVMTATETAKVVGATRPRNLLHEIIRKESAN